MATSANPTASATLTLTVIRTGPLHIKMRPSVAIDTGAVNQSSGVRRRLRRAVYVDWRVPRGWQAPWVKRPSAGYTRACFRLTRLRPSAATCPRVWRSPAGRLRRAAATRQWRTGSATGAIAIRPRAIWRIAWEAGSSGSSITSGRPSSAWARRGIVSGTLPSSGTSSSSASSWPPPSPKIVKRSPDGGREARHVLDHATDLQVDLVRHVRRAPRDFLGCRLGRGDDHELGLRQQLRERHRDVAGARGQIDEQVVEHAPVDVLQELGQRLVQHRPAPDDGGVLLDEEADRHDLHAVWTPAG